MKMFEMKINPKYEIGQTVYLKTDPDQFARMVVGYHVWSNGITYAVAFSSESEVVAEEIELSAEKDNSKAMGLQ